MTTLPPQAYTREMLSSAYSWLQGQPDSIKNLAQSPDALVGLYLRAKRTGEASLESMAPVSRENFRNDLKHLAAELQQFEGNQPTAPTANFGNSNHSSFSSTTSSHQTPSHRTSFSQPENRSMAGDLSFLDDKSRTMIRDVMTRLNLSSETEALRSLITLGYDRMKVVLPPV